MKWVTKMMTTNWKALVKAFVLGLVFLLVYYAPFAHNRHVPLKQWNVYKKHFSNHKIILNKYVYKQDKLINQLEEGEISQQEFIALAKIDSKNKKEELSIFFIKRTSLKKEYSFMGYSSFRYFLYAIGMPIFSMFAIILLLVFLYNPKHLKDFRKFYLVAVSGLMYVTTYWLLHTVLTHTDFKIWAYQFSYILLSAISSSLIILFIYFFSKKESILKEKIRNLIGFITYSRENIVKELALKAKRNNSDNNVNLLIDKHENEMWKTFEKTAK